MHQGIDLAAPKGTPVSATAAGKVVFAGRSGRFGRLVVIDHGGAYETRYAHLKKIKADAGERVERGEVIGTVGRSGNATGYHLHYEVRREGVPVDPRPFLGR
jgi:murein DD-endopeptidase MepM/ murein hydrolase activator NlpD